MDEQERSSQTHGSFAECIKLLRPAAAPLRRARPHPQGPLSGAMGNLVVVLFTIGIVAASFSSADSALTSI